MRYCDLKYKEQKAVNEYVNEDILSENVTTMFDYVTSLYDSNVIELLLLVFGMCAVWMYDGELIVTQCNPIGDIDVYGVGKDLFCVTANGHSTRFEDWKNNPNVVVIYNNKYHTPDLNITRFASLLTEIEKSIENNVINTRYTRLLRARNDIEKKQLEMAIENNKNGAPTVVVASNILEENMTTDGIALDLTNVNAVDKIQYLSQLYADTFARFLSFYGIATYSTNKLAQQSKDEINNGSAGSFVIPLDRLRERKRGVDAVNSKFGVAWSVDFSEIWRLEYERLSARAEKEMLENAVIEQTLTETGGNKDE